MNTAGPIASALMQSLAALIKRLWIMARLFKHFGPRLEYCRTPKRRSDRPAQGVLFLLPGFLVKMFLCTHSKDKRSAVACR